MKHIPRQNLCGQILKTSYIQTGVQKGHLFTGFQGYAQEQELVDLAHGKKFPVVIVQHSFVKAGGKV